MIRLVAGSRLIRLAQGALCAASLLAPAAVLAMTIFENEIYVTEANGVSTLMIEGQEVLSDRRVKIETIGLAGDTPFILGHFGSGGTICTEVSFIVSIETEAPKVDIFPEDCSLFPHEIGYGQIRFSVRGSAVRPPRAWIWRPETGFQEVAAEPSVSESGWDAFDAQTIRTPDGLFRYTDLTDQLRALAGDDFEEFVHVASGPPQSRYEGSTFIAANCHAGDCLSAGTLVIADLAAQEIFMAWEWWENDEVQIRPAVEDWPEDYRLEFETWKDQW